MMLSNFFKKTRENDKYVKKQKIIDNYKKNEKNEFGEGNNCDILFLPIFL